MPKKKLLVVAGAGGSLDFGMPSVVKVHEILDRAAQSEYPLLSDSEENLYSWVYRQILHYWRDVIPRGSEKTPNFEDVLYTIYAMSSAFPAGINTSPIGAIINRRNYPHYVWWWQTVSETNSSTFRQLACYLADEILNDFRHRCSQLPATHGGQLSDLANFFSAIHEIFDVAIVSVNYDDILYQVLKPIQAGFNASGQFDDALLINRSGWPCVLHLHGSIHFDMQIQANKMHVICWQEDLAAQFQQNSSRRNQQTTTEGMEFPMSVIVAGYGKTSQILRRPFRTYYSELDRLSFQSDAVLFLGYGFNDSHVNGAFEKYRDNRRRHVVVVDYADDTAITAHAAWNGNTTAGRAMGVFDTKPHLMRCLGYKTAGQVGDLKQALDFDKSSDPNTPFSIWYNGTATALKNPEKIINELL